MGICRRCTLGPVTGILLLACFGTCLGAIESEPWSFGSIQLGASGGTTGSGGTAHPWSQTQWEPSLHLGPASRSIGQRWWAENPDESVAIGAGVGSGWSWAQVDGQNGLIKARSGAMNYAGPSRSMLGNIIFPAPLTWGDSMAQAGIHQYYQAQTTAQDAGAQVQLNVEGVLEAGPYRHSRYAAGLAVTRILDEDLFFASYEPMNYNRLSDILGSGGFEAWYSSIGYGPDQEIPASQVLQHVGNLFVEGHRDPEDQELVVQESPLLSFAVNDADLLLIETVLMTSAWMENTVHADTSDIRDVFANFHQSASSSLSATEAGLTFEMHELPAIPEPSTLGLLLGATCFALAWQRRHSRQPA